ncbi:MAG TPA: hypothetical protein VHU23_13280 [Rhizomicrobium sp.]|jgi:hypothetical protein|nr:hypothetical protein [Rhizomicrobium sp.]
MSAAPETPGDDLIEGAKAISKFVYGNEKKAKRIYEMVERAKDEGAKILPVFKMGRIICARKSSLLAAIAEMEKAA